MVRKHAFNKFFLGESHRAFSRYFEAYLSIFHCFSQIFKEFLEIFSHFSDFLGIILIILTKEANSAPVFQLFFLIHFSGQFFGNVVKYFVALVFSGE